MIVSRYVFTDEHDHYFAGHSKLSTYVLIFFQSNLLEVRNCSTVFGSRTRKVGN